MAKTLMSTMATRFIRITANGVRVRTFHNVDVLKIWAQRKVQAILRRKNKKRGRKLKFRVSNGSHLLRLTLLRNTIKQAKAVNVVEVVETVPAAV
ncbi:hypothetical protein QR680_008811 [Steinernema hermaphroditum]|uniref:Uncharacterized protein n=1 Tax=Steinernema hermaphroditum TaxID=289476 RepID=A0AA39IJI1_9BILA|nr:hypothetical protein QR680_008811 [Steinernema hermaphroditum]